MIGNNMRCGIATISHRHAAANNPYVEGYDPTKPTNYIIYLDANFIRWRHPLPVGKFQVLSDGEIDQFELMSIPPDGHSGYITECDLTYP